MRKPLKSLLLAAGCGALLASCASDPYYHDRYAYNDGYAYSNRVYERPYYDYPTYGYYGSPYYVAPPSVGFSLGYSRGYWRR